MDLRQILSKVRKWAATEGSVQAAILVGSHARGTPAPTSDIDIVVLTEEKARLVREKDYLKQFGNLIDVRLEEYGAVTSVRAFYQEGLEIELSIAETSWISLPLDKGTEEVLRDGYKIILDKTGLLRKALAGFYKAGTSKKETVIWKSSEG